MLKCCVRCNSRNAVRAVQTNNLRLLKACIADRKNVANVIFAPWSVDATRLYPVRMIFELNNLAMLEAVFKLDLGKKNSIGLTTFDQKFNELYQSERVGVRAPLLTRAD